MRWGPKAITALLALACAWGAACGGGGHGATTISTLSSFPQGLLPLLAGTGRGDVTIRIEGDLYFVDGQTSTVTVVSHTTGESTAFASNVGGASNVLRSITVGFGDDEHLFVGDDAGRIWAIDATGDATLLVDTGTNQPITGLAFAPTGYGDFGGQLFAAAGTAGIWNVLGNPTRANLFTNPPQNHVDLAFSDTALFAINGDTREIDTVSSGGEPAALPSTPAFSKPVGMTVDGTASEIYIADADDGVLYTVPVTGGTPTARAAYAFDSNARGGIVFDGLGAIAFITTDPPAIRGSALPRIDPANPNFARTLPGTTVGYGDLEFDRSGAFVLVANQNDPNSTTDVTNNFLFGMARDASGFTALSLDRNIVSAADDLLGVAVDPIKQVIYFSSRLGKIYKRAADGTVSVLPLPEPPDPSPPAILGLELEPDDQGRPSGPLVATTDTGRMFEIDPVDPLNSREISLNPPLSSNSRLSDLVFSTEGTLYVLDNEPSSASRILIVSLEDGSVEDLVTNPVEAAQLGRPDGIEIDEGGNRLLVTSQTAAGDRLLAVAIATGEVTTLRTISIDDGFLPTGVVYDRLGTAVVRKGNVSAGLQPQDVRP